MENKEINLIEIFRDVWGKKRKVLKWSMYGLMVGVIISFSIPKEYISFVRVAPESSSSNDGLSQLSGLAAMAGISSGTTQGKNGIDESVYPEVVKSTPFLNEFSSIKVPYNEDSITLMRYLTKEQNKEWWKYVLYVPSDLIGWTSSLFSSVNNDFAETQYNPSPEKRLFEYELSNRLSVEIDKKTKLIKMSVSMQSPQIAAIIADSMFVKLSRYMTNYYTAKARQNLTVSLEMLNTAKEKYYHSDSAYAAAMDRNQNLISKSAQMKIERYENERNIAYNVYQQLAGQVETVKIKLQEDTPIATVIEPARTPIVPNSPNKKLIILGCAIIGLLSKIGVIVWNKIQIVNE